MKFIERLRMSSGRSSKLWIVNVISFILFIILFVTGLLNWLVLPRGYEARGSFSVSLRHFFIAIHEWAAMIFMVLIAVHIVLHWPYIKSNLKKYGIIK
jgi:cytochrome b subunit of formate dehydrogenase